MPLFNFFKKSTEKDPVPARDDSLLSPEMQRKRYEAAMEFVKIFQEKTPLVGGKPHAGTVLAVAARLAGSSLYRSMNYKHIPTPGVIMLSNEVNEAWPQLMNLFAFYCKQKGLDIMAKPLVTKFSEQDKPRMDVEQILAEYQDQYHTIMQRHGLDYLNGARAGIVICSIFFQYHCTVVKDIDPYVGAGIIAIGIVEGAKTTPPPLKPVNSAAPVSSNPGQTNQLTEVLRSVAENSISGSGTRLVLGEGIISMQEALSKGGKYILVHPEVVNQLKQNNIDPFLVYEAALQMEVESKIPQIDFVSVDVDKLSHEWNGKPVIQIPIPVRQALWLMNHAKRYGYEQRGNSWILK